MIDELCDRPCEEDIAIAMFYCDFRDKQEQTAINVMGAILKQLLVRGEVLENVREAFQKAKGEVGGRGLRLPNIVRMLKDAIAVLPKVFICIDALDECLPKNLLELLGSMEDILRESPRVRIFVTGRSQVEAEITRAFTNNITVPISPKMHDVERYLENKLKLDTEHYAMSDSLRADILRIIPERISGMCVRASIVSSLCMILYSLIMVYRFLLVSLTIDAILGEVSISARREKLTEMTKGNRLGDAYATTLDRMKTQEGGRFRLGMEALMWVSNSERPLHTSELCHALGVKIGSADLDVENVPEIRTILGCALGLITVETSSDTVRFVHFTLQEYLSGNPSLSASPHSMIAEVCLTYLNFRCVRKLSPNIRSVPSTVPLVKYASCYWGKHLRREKTESVTLLALRLLDGFEKHISSPLLFLHNCKQLDSWDWAPETLTPEAFTGLHGAASVGISEVVTDLLATRKWDINAGDTVGRTALAWAALGGHEDVVKILLRRRDVHPNAPDVEYGRAPLWLAAKGGYEGIVGLLLERKDIDPNTVGMWDGQTPLWWAAEGGHEGIVSLLLKREDVNPNTPDTLNGRTPLWLAAMSGYERIVGLLLERVDIDPNAADISDGRTPLWWAAEGGDEGIVQLLLEREDIDPNTADTENRQSPLWWAAQRGYEGIVRLLLKRRDIDANTADARDGRTPLSWAAGGGYAGIVKLLLGQGGINPNTPDTLSGRTPLWWAAQGGYEGIVKLLLEREDINPNTIDTGCGRTPLWWATQSGYEGIAKLLLERQDTNPNTADTLDGRTPLSCAAEGGYEGIVRLILERENTNPNTPDTKYGQTPLWWAAKGGHEGIVNLLLKRQDINANTADTRDGRTPLSWAAEGGYEGIVKLLLERPDTNSNTPDTLSGRTPLWWAAQRGSEGAVRLLLERENTNPNTPDTKYGQTPLWWAAKGGHEGIVRLLLKGQDINANTPDTTFRRTPVWWAAEGGYGGIAKLLLEREGIDPSTADTIYSRTPLWWAAQGGHEGIAKWLLEREDIDPNTADSKYGRTPLLLAAVGGHGGIVKLLLEREDLNPNIPDLTGGTALALARSLGHARVVQLLAEPKSSLPISIDTEKVPERSSPEPSIPLSPSKPLPPATEPLLAIAIPFFVIISSIFLLYFLALIGPSFSALITNLQSFYR